MCYQQLTLILLLSIPLTLGCGSGEEPAAEGDSPSTTQQTDSQTEQVSPTGSSDSSPTEDASSQRVPLTFSLGLNQPVPLLKTVNQSLQQQTPQGNRLSRSSLQLLVTLWVAKAADNGDRLLSVRYDRVRYWQDIAGETFQYDSTRPPESLPLEAVPYHGLVNNGFSFWIDRHHRLKRPVGFADFLDRCIAGVPEDRKQDVLLSFAYSTDESIATFVDDVMGVLPPISRKVRKGDNWTREERLHRPMPLFVRNQCSLNELNDQTAVIEVAGAIARAQTFGPATQNNRHSNGLKVTVTGGHTTGTATIDRPTGLPLQSRIKRLIRMIVEHPDGGQFVQEKITHSQVQLFPQQSSEHVPQVIQPVSAEIPR